MNTDRTTKKQEVIDTINGAIRAVEQLEGSVDQTNAVTKLCEAAQYMKQDIDQTRKRVEAIAAVCHEANRQYCALLGDTSQKPWSEAEEWQRKSAIDGVEFALQNPSATPADQHTKWMEDKLKDGWTYGPIKDPAKKTHPCLTAYFNLPVEQRRKDSLFRAIVDALAQ